MTPRAGAEAVPFDAYRAGFDDVDEYLTWLALDGDRRLRLFLREERDRSGEAFDGLREVLQPEPAGPVPAVYSAVGAEQHGAGVLGLLRRSVRVTQRGRVRHGFAPSRDGEASVGGGGGSASAACRRPLPGGGR